MKILHTSDWHLGHLLYKRERMDEFDDMVKQIAKIVNTEKPDVMVISGDIYDVSQPSATVKKFFNESLLNIHKEYKDMHIVVTAGNHDSPSQVEEAQKLWEYFDVKIVGKLKRIDGEVDIDAHIFEIGGKGWVVAVPHLLGNDYGIFQRLLDEVNKRNKDMNLPIVMMAHLAVKDSDITGHSQDIIGGMDTQEVGNLGTGYDYLALGHIHCPQFIKKTNNRVCYCGTPIPISFDENYTHYVNIVEIPHHGGEVTVTQKEITPKRKLKTIPKDAVDFDKALDVLAEMEKDDDSYIRLKVKIKDFLPANGDARITNHINQNGLKCRYCTMLGVKETTEGTNEGDTPVAINLVADTNIEPLDIAKDYYKRKYETEMGDDLITLFNEAINEVKNQTEEL